MCNWKKGLFLLYQEHQRCCKVQQTKNRRRPTGVVEATASSISLVQLARVEEEGDLGLNLDLLGARVESVLHVHLDDRVGPLHGYSQHLIA